ncbi:MAG TPA: phosphohistidine phosphatase SixA [Cyclobacteriaceae bacterium]
MSRFLYLMRHAQSADKQPGQPDKERELTQQGVQDAMLAGKYLQHQKINLDLLLCSTAVRANRTAELIIESINLDSNKVQFEDELYTASVRTFLALITQLDDSAGSVMCIGHNPVISYLAELLTKAEIGDMPPAAMTIIRFNANHWKDVHQGTGEFISILTPEQFKNA